MLKKILFFLILGISVVYAEEQKTKITKEQFCHFTYGIYQQCYQRGLIAGTNCEKLSKGIRFGKGFNKKQIKYIQESCKIGCFLGKNKFKIKTENSFTSTCIKK